MKDNWIILILILFIIIYDLLLGAFCAWLFCLAFGFTFSWAKAAVFWFIFIVLLGGTKIYLEK